MNIFFSSHLIKDEVIFEYCKASRKPIIQSIIKPITISSTSKGIYMLSVLLDFKSGERFRRIYLHTAPILAKMLGYLGLPGLTIITAATRSGLNAPAR